jgi:DNA-binding CsgD family transcriptional regulator
MSRVVEGPQVAVADVLTSGREAFKRRAWAEAFAQLSAADQTSPLAPDDLDRFAVAAYLLGRDEDSSSIWARAHRALAGMGDYAAAARCAFWIAFGFLDRGEHARSAGWLAKARRLLDQTKGECAEHGYVALPGAIEQIYAGDLAGAMEVVDAAVLLGERCGDADLVAFARCVQGRALIRLGRVAEGMALLDEVMVTVVTDDVSPVLVGDLYCTVVEGCWDAFDLRRAREWTAALSQWCDAQPDLVRYRGQCLVHRAEIMLLHGSWPQARDAVWSSYERLTHPPAHPAAGAARYVMAELHRLAGEFGEADEAYRGASERGRQPHPGLARLRLAQGRGDRALAAIRRALSETAEPAIRPSLLEAAVEILLATGDVSAARTSATELVGVAATLDVPLLQAMAAQADGTVLSAEGEAQAGLVQLRRAWTLWHSLDAPYDAARARVLIGVACRAAGDEDGAQLEFDAAASVFDHLGAAPDLAHVKTLSGRVPAAAANALTTRELEVLRLVADGRSNRTIAADLHLSEKTVARHVTNILTKLDLPSRSAATAHAFRHGLI